MAGNQAGPQPEDGYITGNFYMDKKMISLLITLMSFAVNPMIQAPEHQYLFGIDGTAAFISYRNWQIISQYKWRVEANIVRCNHQESLWWIAQGWCKLYDYGDFAQLARKWNPKVTASPKDCFTVGGKIHFYGDCPHIVGNVNISSCECGTDPNAFCLTCVARRLREETP